MKMHHSPHSPVENPQPLNLSISPRRTPSHSPVYARDEAEDQVTSSVHRGHCRCPKQDSKSTILYKLLTDAGDKHCCSFSHFPCCSSEMMFNRRCLHSGGSKLKLLLEESKRQAVQ